jgi:hypothetical protein
MLQNIFKNAFFLPLGPGGPGGPSKMAVGRSPVTEDSIPLSPLLPFIKD